jgi:hypothetical protein
VCVCVCVCVYIYIYIYIYIWCGYEVSGIILSHRLKGAMRLNHSKYMSVHVSTCTKYDFNALASVVWKLWR